jgi:hypothetical protein
MRDRNGRREQRAAGDRGVIFAALAARIDAETLELLAHLAAQRASQPALVEKLRARGHDDRVRA